MTDIEMTMACAQALGWTAYENDGRCFLSRTETQGFSAPKQKRMIYSFSYWPLTNDGQALHLVRTLGLCIAKVPSSPWAVVFGNRPSSYNEDLNRAIVECVAKMQKERSSATQA